jgi:cytochrome c biogenesis protein CcdA
MRARLDNALRRQRSKFSDNPLVFRLVGLVASIGIADSLNPSTLAPALYLATGKHARRDVARFTLGVFVVYMAGGAAVALGPGELIFDAIPHPHHNLRHVLEIIAGVIVLAVGLYVWRHRDRLSTRDTPRATVPGRRSSMLLGMAITAVELPTAFPYFAAITAIVGASLSPLHVLALLALFNVCFILPLLGILLTLWFAGDGALAILTRIREFLNRHWPVILAVAAFLAGSIAILIGISGMVIGYTGDIPNFVRRIRHLLHLSTKP